jgi:hypothetical protein
MDRDPVGEKFPPVRLKPKPAKLHELKRFLGHHP